MTVPGSLRTLLTAGALLLLTLSGLAAEPEAAATENAAREINPRFLLLDPKGRMVSNEDFRGRFQLITFGYTSCPDVCPTTLAVMSQVLAQLGPQASRLQPIFISVDPERDKRDMLGRYTAYFDDRILGLTGSADLVKSAADHYKVTYKKYLEPGAAPNSYSIDHSVGMYLLGTEGEFVTRFPYSATAREIAARIRTMMTAGASSTLPARP